MSRSITIALSFLVLLLLPSGIAVAQHDPGRDAVRNFAQGKVDKGVETAGKTPKPLNSPISEAEQHFLMALAECLRNNPEEAFSEAKKALAAGLPPGRILAGPRGTLAPLYGHSDYPALMAKYPVGLLHGPMLGVVTDTSARFWVRTEKPRKVTVRIGDHSAMAETQEERDFTAVLELVGLKPATRYSYQVFLEGKKAVAEGEFRTFPKKGAPASFTIGFGGGAGFTPGKERMWKTIAAQDLSALFMLGDNVYIDDPQHEITQQYCYYRRQSQSDWRKLVSTFPVYSIWDDHDFGTNDCAHGSEIESPPWKREVWKVFTCNWNNPSYGGGRENPGCWYDFYIGDVHFIFLDCRYYREKGVSILGPFQKEWLLKTLASSRGTFKVLASSVPWSPGVKPRSRDTWDGFSEEREEIFSFIEEKKINGVVLMAADRHRSDLRMIPREKGYDLLEFMSSRLTNVHVHGLVPNAKGSTFLFGYNKKCSFGMITFDTKKKDPELSCRIMNIDGELIHERKQSLRTLSHGKR